jgi:hypothetical protein
MYAHRHRRPVRAPAAARIAAARLRRLASVVAAATCGLLASAAVVPAAFAMNVPGGGQARPADAVRVIAGGMAGWQITMIALGAALVAAAATLLLDRVLRVGRAVTATTA